MKPNFWKIVGNIILLLPVGMCFYAWIALLHIGHDVIYPAMDQPEAIQAVFMMCGANMFGIVGTIVLAYWFYFRACEKVQKTARQTADRCRKPSVEFR